MKLSNIAMIIGAAFASVSFTASAVKDPNKYGQDNHYIMLDIMQVESEVNALEWKMDSQKVDLSNLTGRVDTNEADIAELKQTADQVDGVINYVTNNREEIQAKFQKEVNNSVNNYVVNNQAGFDAHIQKVVEGTMADNPAVDLDPINQQLAQNSKDIERQEKLIRDEKSKMDGVSTIMFGGKATTNENGTFVGFKREESGQLVVGPNGELYGYKENAGLYGRYRLFEDATNAELGRLDKVKANKDDLIALDSRVEVVEGDVAVINGKIEKVERVGGKIAANVDVIVDKGNSVIEGAKTSINNSIDNKIEIAKGEVNTQIDNSITNIVNGGNTEINAKWEGAKATANDFDERITANKNRIDDQAGRIGKVEDLSAQNAKDVKAANKELVRLDNVKADKTDLDALGGRVDVIEGDVATINGKIEKVEGNKDLIISKAGDAYTNVRTDITNEINSTVTGAIDVAIDNAKTTVNNKWEENKGDIVANVNGKVENIQNDITNNVMNQIGDIVIDGNSETVINIKNDITKDVTNQLKLDGKGVALNIKKEIQEGNNDIYNNISGKIEGKFDDQYATLVAMGQAESDRLEAKKADKADLDAAVQAGKDEAANINASIGAMGDRVTNVEGDVSNIKQDVTNIQGDITTIQGDVANINGKISYVENNSQEIINKAGAAVDAKIDVAYEGAKTEVTNLYDNARTEITNEIDNAVNVAVEGARTEVNNKYETIKNEVVNGDNNTYNSIKADISKDVKNEIVNNITEGNNTVVNEIKDGLVEEIREEGKTVVVDLQDQIDAANARIDVQTGRGEQAWASYQEDRAYATQQYTQDRQVAVTTYNNARVEAESAYVTMDDKKADKSDLDVLNDKIDGVAANGKTDEEIKAIADQAAADAVNNAKKEVVVAVKDKAPVVNEAVTAAKTEAKKQVQASIDASISKAKAAAKDQAGQAVAAAKEKARAELAAAMPELKGKAEVVRTEAVETRKRADLALKATQDNHTAIQQERADRIQGQRETLQSANNYTDQKVEQLRGEVEHNRRKAAAGIAGVAAMTNIPTISQGKNFAIGAGMGYYDGEQSLAIGSQGRFNENLTGKATISTDFHGNTVIGAGVGFEW
ncbi:putative YadA-like protein [Aeromonas phage D3]|uniref:Putative YadA-like protein n=1 Tax=Aeromonas phage D3 TaxID=2593327 RepID=A0A514TVV7_9CAUD|nr:putative YadA-like protein [Aeromonas phage D3]QDJ97161.1 putative YadA-like protein [Aeromonas phage D3]